MLVKNKMADMQTWDGPWGLVAVKLMNPALDRG